jgi:hypothetical protein
MMMRRKKGGFLRGFWTVFVLVLFIFAGCGGSNDSSSTSNVDDDVISGDDTTADAADDDGILIFSNFQAADVVIGQSDFTSDAYSGGAAADNFASLYGSPVVYNDILYLPDGGYNRVLGFDGIPTINGASADFVLGQTDFTTTTSGNTASTMNAPEAISVYDGKLFLTDYYNHRVMIYNTIPTSGPGTADVVVGQSDFGSSGSALSDSRLNRPKELIAVDGKLIVADTHNHRVMIWNSIPTTHGVAADIVVGQSDFDHGVANDDDQDGASDGQPSARTMCYPSGVWSDGTRLAVLDTNNSRVLIWNEFPTASFTPADVVLGQADFTHNQYNDDNQDGVDDGAPTARTLCTPNNGVYSKNDRLFVADSENNRVLIWDAFPTENFTPADVVLGQADFTHNAYNDADQDGSEDGSPSATTLADPRGIYVDGDKLIVGDFGNYRVLVYEAL